MKEGTWSGTFPPRKARAGSKALYARAGLEAPAEVAQAGGREAAVAEKSKGVGQSGKAKEDVQARPETPEPDAAPRASGLSSLLGSWWGRK